MSADDMDDMIDWFRLERYIAGEATATEQVQVERWMAAHDDHQRTVARVAAALDARRRHTVRDWDRTAAINAVMARVRAEHAQRTTAAVSPRPKVAASPMTEGLMQRLRYWFEGATELAAAMLLDLGESPLTDDEVRQLRDRIDDAKRDKS